MDTHTRVAAAVRQSPMPQYRIARRLGMSPGALSDRMRGRTPWQLSDLNELSRILDVELCCLLGCRKLSRAPWGGAS